MVCMADPGFSVGGRVPRCFEENATPDMASNCFPLMISLHCMPTHWIACMSLKDPSLHVQLEICTIL